MGLKTHATFTPVFFPEVLLLAFYAFCVFVFLCFCG